MPLRRGSVRSDADRRLCHDPPLQLFLLRMRGAIAVSAEMASLRIVEGEDALARYRFNTMVAEHFFCSRCGIYTHHQRRSDPDLYGVNVACLAGVSPFDFLEVPVTDGVHHSKDNGGVTRLAGTLRFTPADEGA
jgi:hypothetical protein